MHYSICKSYASLFLLLFRGSVHSGLLTSDNVCSVGKHLVCVGGQFVLFDVSQSPQLLSDFILIFGLYGDPFTLLNKVDFHKFEQLPGQVGG